MSSDSQSDLAIRAQGLGKAYRIFARPENRLKQMFLGKWRQFYSEFWALRDLNLEVPHGQTLGIIGSNGCGKSTLLQLICGTLSPTAGRLEVNGRVAALLELGAGFNPEFTGRDNVFLNGAILGMTPRQIDERFDQIAAFADIGEFLNQPVKTYSSGMYARLAFAVAIHVEPDIFIVDEILSVGDEAFQRKCFARIREIRDRGATVLFVSHGAGNIISLCDRALLLEHGRRLLLAQPKLAIARYQKLIYAPAEKIAAIRQETFALDRAGGQETSVHVNADANANANADSDANANADANADSAPAPPAAAPAATSSDYYDPGMVPRSFVAYTPHGAQILDPTISEPGGQRVNVLQSGRTYRYSYLVSFDRPATNVRFGMMIKNVIGVELAGCVSHAPSNGLEFVDEGQQVEVVFEFRNLLAAGSYFLNAGVLGRLDSGGEVWLHRLLDAVMFRVDPVGFSNSTGHVNLMTDDFCRIKSVAQLGKAG